MGTLIVLSLIGAMGCLMFLRQKNTPEYPSGFVKTSAFPASSPVAAALNTKKYVVYGFAPYWNLDRTTVRPELTHFMYFSLPMTEDGGLDGITTPGKSVSRTRWESDRLAKAVDTLAPGQEFAITFTQFNNEAIEKLLSSPSAQLKYTASVNQLLDTSQYPISAINLDVEYNGNATPELRQQYVAFVKHTKDTLLERQKRGKPAVQLSLSIYASAANKPWLWDVKELAPHLDYIVVMAYDFHRTTSPIAGPVAPIFGGREEWGSDIITHLEEFLAKVPAEKIILGIPFYGYEWETTSPDSKASVFPGTGSTASYQRVQTLLQEKDKLGIEAHWDEKALSPYLTFLQNDRAHVIYYEDQRSLSYKLDLVRDLRLAGVAIWALGYENESREPWDVIHDKLSSP